VRRRSISSTIRPLSLAARQLDIPTVSLRDLLAGRGAEVTGRTNAGLETYVDEIVRSGLPGMQAYRGRALARRARRRRDQYRSGGLPPQRRYRCHSGRVTRTLMERRSGVRFTRHIGIDHAFFFPMSGMARYGIKSQDQFLDDFMQHRPTADPNTYAALLRDGFEVPDGRSVVAEVYPVRSDHQTPRNRDR